MIEVHSNLVKEFKHWVFPGGEVGVKFEFNDSGFQHFAIKWKVENKSNLHQEFFIVANAVDAIRQKFPKADIYLLIPYYPYARQDRVCHEGESHAMKVFENLLSTLPVTKVIVRDLHSNTNSIDLGEVQQWLCLSKFPTDRYQFLVAPDKGASEKVKRCMEVCSNAKFHVTLNKVRKDGKVIHEPLGFIKSPAYRALVVDDICDGGATFISVAKAIKECNPHVQLDLYVTHGIFSKGLDELSLYYNKIFCYNLMNLDLVDQVDHII